MGENRKQVNAILRRVAKRAQKVADKPVRKDGQEAPLTVGSVLQDAADRPFFIDPPFACPPDDEAAK